MRRGTTATATLLLALALTPATAVGDGFGILGAAHRLDDPPYRYVVLSPYTRHPLTVVERIDLRDSTIDRWWYLRGTYYLPAVAADGSAGGIADGKLILSTLPRGNPPRGTGFAIPATPPF